MDTIPAQLTDARGCIKAAFAEGSRPSLRSFLDWKAKGYVPYKKIGRRVYYDATEVRRALDRHFSVKARA